MGRGGSPVRGRQYVNAGGELVNDQYQNVYDQYQNVYDQYQNVYDRLAEISLSNIFSMLFDLRSSLAFLLILDSVLSLTSDFSILVD